MNRTTKYLCAAALVCFVAIAAYADINGDMRRKFGITTTWSGATPIPTFPNGAINNGISLSATVVGTTSVSAGDAGGDAGIVYIYPGTASKGWAELSKTANSSSNTKTQIIVDDQAATRAYHVPDFGATSYFLASTTALASSKGDFLNVTAGAATASKAVVLDSSSLYDGTKLNGLDYSIAAAGSAFAPSSSSEAVMNLGTYTITASRLQALGYIDFSAVALVGAVNATDTFTFDVELSSTSGSDTAGTVVATKVLGATEAANDYAIVNGRIDVRSIVTTTCTMTSAYSAGGLLAGTLASETKAFVAAFTKDSTAALYLNVTGKWSTNSATNSATLQQFDVKVVGS